VRRTDPSNLLAYSVTKTALLGLSKGLSGLTKESKVTVNALLPGSTLTEGAEKFLEAVAEKTGKSADQVEKEFLSLIVPIHLYNASKPFKKLRMQLFFMQPFRFCH